MEEKVQKSIVYDVSEQEKILILKMELHDLIVSFITSIIWEFGSRGVEFCKELIKNRLSALLMGYKQFFKISSNDAVSIASLIVSRRRLIGEDCYVLKLDSKKCEADIKNCPAIKTKNQIEICEIFSGGENAAAKMINPNATVTCRRLTTKKRPQCRLIIRIED
ncbi:MAG: hypothetical protein QXV37_01510 [Candidatus Jordarchaeaceae archaeon]